MPYPRSLPAALFAFLLAAPARAEVDFVKDIKPILEANCVRCHSGEKPKGGLSMETRAAFLKGGEENEGKDLIPGKGAVSKAYTSLLLAKDAEGHMPPEGDRLPKATADKLKAWIDEGAKWPEALVLKSPDAKEEPKDTVEVKGLPITPAEKAAVEKLEKAGVFAMRLAQNTNWLRVDFTHRGKEVKDEELALLKDCPNLVELNLGGTNITDSGLAHLKPLTNLVRLQLHKTKISDAGLANLAGLEKLTSLNLYDTPVTDAGIMQLKGLKHLKRLYVWQTKVTEPGAKQLAAAIPGIDINRGYELPPEPKKEEPKKDPKKDEPKKDVKKDPPKEDEPKKDVKKDEPKKDQPKKDEPKKDAPKKDEPKKG
jgi:mono/diheme cytochrome c family protein